MNLNVVCVARVLVWVVQADSISFPLERICDIIEVATYETVDRRDSDILVESFCE